MNHQLPGIEQIRQAADRIKPYVHKTPVLTSESINRMTGTRIWFKCENFQKTGAFKFRGGCNAVFSLPDEEAASGVATHSSGNHAQALALAARLRGIPTHIVMPSSSSRVKVNAVKEYGAEIIFCDPTQQAREAAARDVVEQTGARLIHPYNDPAIIAGQGTAALELLKKFPRLDTIITPVGGGGLLSGTAIAAKHLKPDIRVIGAEPEQADDAYRSFHAGRLIRPESTDTIADGLRTSLGELTYAVIASHADDIVTVPEESIIRAMRIIWERMKIIIEPSSAVPVAALMDKKLGSGSRIGIILSGGNADLDQLPWA